MADERVETYKHIHHVQGYLNRVIVCLMNRQAKHDQSKLESPEKEIFDEVTPRLAALTFGSPEYNASLSEIKPALEHHYAKNDHHPEHFPDGIKGMSLLSITEMLCDWKAATLRHNDGNIMKSIEIQQKRFGFSDELKSILMNTVKQLGMED